MKQPLFAAVLASIALSACHPSEKRTTDETVAADWSVSVPDTSWCDRLMPPHGGGVTGGDGAISIDLKDGRSLFMWGDSFFGDVDRDIRSKDSHFVMGNTFTVLHPDGSIRTLHGGSASRPSAFIAAGEEGDDIRWYWPGNGFVRNGILHLFMSEFRKTGSGTFAFEYLGCDYFRLDVQTFQVIGRTRFDAPDRNGVHYGHAVAVDRDDVYVYGTLADASGAEAVAHVARAVLKDDSLQQFRYWDGRQWQDDPQKSRALEGLPARISEQFSVFPLEGKWVLVSQNRSGNIKEIWSYVADKPQGPFARPRLLHTVDEPGFEADRMMTYNAMAHPQYVKDGRMLMCYNVNTYDMEKVFVKASLYQPRFFWVSVKQIMGEANGKEE